MLGGIFIFKIPKDFSRPFRLHMHSRKSLNHQLRKSHMSTYLFKATCTRADGTSLRGVKPDFKGSRYDNAEHFATVAFRIGQSIRESRAKKFGRPAGLPYLHCVEEKQCADGSRVFALTFPSGAPVFVRVSFVKVVERDGVRNEKGEPSCFHLSPRGLVLHCNRSRSTACITSPIKISNVLGRIADAENQGVVDDIIAALVA